MCPRITCPNCDNGTYHKGTCENCDFDPLSATVDENALRHITAITAPEGICFVSSEKPFPRISFSSSQLMLIAELAEVIGYRGDYFTRYDELFDTYTYGFDLVKDKAELSGIVGSGITGGT